MILRKTPLKVYSNLELKEKKINILDFKNANWREADQLAIYKHDRGVVESTKKQLQL